MTLRPYQTLCTVCSLGQDGAEPQDGKSAEILGAVRKCPDMPITLRCNAGDVFVYQDPGTDDDTPEGAEYNRKRDLDILQKLNFMPGVTIPARILFHRLLDRITTVSGICGYGAVTCEEWRGCPKAASGQYKKAREKGIDAIVPPRTEEEMEKDKEESLAAMYGAQKTGITVRPHILVCAVCQYGGGTRPPFRPDNLPELIQLILKEPETQITMAEAADWMMCAPCDHRSPELNACVNVKGSGGLVNQLRDLRTLQILGLTYGSTMNARELYQLIFERVQSTVDICRFESPDPSVWRDGCGSRECSSESYDEGRKELMRLLGCDEMVGESAVSTTEGDQ